MRPVTIVIPTRNRSDTLHWCLRSCLSQDYEQLTILVSDNCSTDDTAAVVDAFTDPRLKYIKTPAPTSMSGNLEFALSHCTETDGWVTTIGDDDGLIPGALAHANTLLDANPEIDTLTWPESSYTWPSCLLADLANRLNLNVGANARILDSKTMLQKLASHEVYYHHLPGLWTSLVPTWALRECRKRLGKYAISAIPDAASAVSNACFIPKYLYSERPVTILGSSSHSNGLSSKIGRTEIVNRFYSEATIPPHKDLAKNQSRSYFCTESLLWARDLEILPKDVTIDLRESLEHMLVRYPAYAPSVFDDILVAVGETAKMHGVNLDCSPREPDNPATPKLFSDPIVTEFEDRIFLRCDPNIVTNIFDATNLAASLISATSQAAIRTKRDFNIHKAKSDARLDKLKAKLSEMESKSRRRSLSSRLRALIGR